MSYEAKTLPAAINFRQQKSNIKTSLKVKGQGQTQLILLGL